MCAPSHLDDFEPERVGLIENDGIARRKRHTEMQSATGNLAVRRIAQRVQKPTRFDRNACVERNDADVALPKRCRKPFAHGNVDAESPRLNQKCDFPERHRGHLQSSGNSRPPNASKRRLLHRAPSDEP
jgi:hypothetical protein